MSRYHKLETLAEYEAEGFTVHVQCACSHIKVLAPAKLAEMCRAKGLGDRIEDIKPHLKCSKCGGRPTHVQERRGW